MSFYGSFMEQSHTFENQIYVNLNICSVFKYDNRVSRSVRELL